MKIHRWDSEGREVTDLPGLWDEGDLEVCRTSYSHPSDTSGMRISETIWFRLIGGEWATTGEKRLHVVREQWIAGELFSKSK